jgi:hypothetical protein
MSAIGWIWLIVVLAIPAALLALVALFAGSGLGAIVLVSAYALLLVLWVWAQGRLALRSVAARRLEPGFAPRLENLVSGLAAELGVRPPQVWITAEVGPNAMVARAGGTVLTVSLSSLQQLTRTELEALVAHSLLRSGSSSLWRGSIAAALGPAAGPAGPHVGPIEDGVAVAFTRFPPALASTVAKSDPVAGRFAVLWFSGRGPYHAAPEARIAALNEL